MTHHSFMLDIYAASLLQVSTWSLALGLFVAVCYSVVRSLHQDKQNERLPPSLPGHWLFGNAPPTT